MQKSSPLLAFPSCPSPITPSTTLVCSAYMSTPHLLWPLEPLQSVAECVPEYCPPSRPTTQHNTTFFRRSTYLQGGYPCLLEPTFFFSARIRRYEMSRAMSVVRSQDLAEPPLRAWHPPTSCQEPLPDPQPSSGRGYSDDTTRRSSRYRS